MALHLNKNMSEPEVIKRIKFQIDRLFTQLNEYGTIIGDLDYDARIFYWDYITDIEQENNPKYLIGLLALILVIIEDRRNGVYFENYSELDNEVLRGMKKLSFQSKLINELIELIKNVLTLNTRTFSINQERELAQKYKQVYNKIVSAIGTVSD